MRRKPQVVAASMLLALLVLGRESLAQIAVLRVRGTVGEGLQTGYAGSISPGPWREGRSFGRFKSWPRTGADFRLGGNAVRSREGLGRGGSAVGGGPAAAAGRGRLH